MPLPLEIAICTALAQAFSSADSLPDMVARADHLLGSRWRWVRLLVKRCAAANPSETRPRYRDIYHFLAEDGAIRRALYRHPGQIHLAHTLTGPPRMRPVPAAQPWNLPAIETLGDLAQWFWLSPEQLDWFAGLNRFAQKNGSEQLQHYRYRLEPKAHGGLRLIEIPKPRIRKLQRQILHYILNLIPAHPAANGFVKGRGILSFAQPHAAKPIVLRLDLQDFFPSIYGPRVQTLFRTFGYPENVADSLGGICTNVVPHHVWTTTPEGITHDAKVAAQALYRSSHLPQGAPTSPALANLCAYRLDCRLAGLAKAAGAVYTRYADDLAFSGDAPFAHGVDRFATQVAAIAAAEGFSVNHRKTRIMRQGVRQHLAGLTVNEKPNIRRDTFDELKAILTNCLRHGPTTQNRDNHPDFRAHLEGRVSFVASIHPAKGLKLQTLLRNVPWPIG